MVIILRQAKTDRGDLGILGRPRYTRNRKTMTENKIDDIRKARYMSLSGPPTSPEAKGLVEDVTYIITNSEKRHKARKADGVPIFKSAMGLTIGDLLIGFHT